MRARPSNSSTIWDFLGISDLEPEKQNCVFDCSKTSFNCLGKCDNDKCKYSILPVENSIEGSVGQSIDVIANTDLHSIGEVYLKVEHCLIGRGKLDDVTKVYSHPQALGQCSDFIFDHDLKTVPTYDTAGSVEIIKDLEDNCAAIASRLASSLYDVPIIKEGIENNSNNYNKIIMNLIII